MKPNMHLRVFLVIAGILGSAHSAVAADTIKVIDSDLRVVLQTASRVTGQKIQLSPFLKGVVRAQDLPADLSKILPILEKELQLEWYNDAETFYVSAKSESISRVVDLNRISFETLKTAMDEAGIKTGNHELRLMEDADSIYFTGPPSLANRIQGVVRNLNLEQKRRGKKYVKIIRNGVTSYVQDEEPQDN